MYASRFVFTTLSMLIVARGQASDTAQAEDLLKRARSAITKGQFEVAIRLSSEALDTSSTNVDARLLRARAYEGLRRHEDALGDYDQLIKLHPSNDRLYDLRGAARFKSGDVPGSIVDFDKQIALDPTTEPRHWQRGISYYYDQQYKKGAKQFENYQTYDAGDVENVVWRFLCQSKYDGVARARGDMLPLARVDRRMPMMKIYDLFLGRATPEEVFAAAQEDRPGTGDRQTSLFYAHLYVGLYHDAHGDTQQMRKHIFAAQKHQISHYMGDVAHVHAQRLRKADARARG